MPIDASIYSQIQQPKIDNPLNALAQVAQLQHYQSQNKLADLTYGEKQREVAGDNALAGLIASGKKGDDVTAGLASQGYGKSALAYAKQQQEILKQQTDIGKTKSETAKVDQETAAHQFELAGQIVGSWAQDPTITPQRIQSGLAAAVNSKIISPEIYQAKIAELQNVGQDPASLNTWAKGTLAQVMKAKDSTALMVPDANAKLQAKTSTDNNAATNATSRANAQDRLSYDKSQPKGQVVQSDQGLMLVDPRAATAQPITANGQPLQPKLKDLPAPISKALLENNVSLRKIDQALKEIENYPDALGVKNYLGDSIRQRSDPKGINARALVSDIGSLKIHDRSGAAVTAAETPRLKPFIPTATDDPATVKKKLNLFKQEYEAIQNDITSTYTREQGYNQRAPAAKTPASNIDDLLKKYGG